MVLGAFIKRVVVCRLWVGFLGVVEILDRVPLQDLKDRGEAMRLNNKGSRAP